MTTRLTDRSTIETTRWRLDPGRSTVEFRVKMLWGMMTVAGRFAEYAATLDLSADPAVVLTIDAASFDTKQKKRDEHLRSADFFDTEQHPYIRFASETAALDDRRLVSGGLLSFRGTTLPLSIAATLSSAGDELEVESVTDVDYRRLGITWGKGWSRAGVLLTPGQLVVKGRLIRESGSTGREPGAAG